MKDFAGRLSWKHASIIMALATLVPPFMTVFSHLDGQSISVAIVALIWAIFPPSSPTSGFQILDGNWLQGSLPLGFFNIVFAFQVIRFIRGKSSKVKTLAVGVMTIIIPMIAFFGMLPYMISRQIFVYVGPIPIQLVIGLFLMRFFAPEEPTTPW
jgi:hypothetical protein